MNTVRKEVPRAGGVDGRQHILFLAGTYLLLQAYLWLVVPTRNNILIGAGALLVLAVIVLDPWRRGESPSSVGITLENFLPALKLLLLPSLAIVVLLVAINRTVEGAPAALQFERRFLRILPWALLQQALLQATFNRRLVAVMGPGSRSSLVNGVFFALMHLPNPLLTAATFVTGAWWSRVYQKRPNLWALVLCHAVLSAAAQGLLPASWTHGFRVGPGYFRFR